MSSSTSKDLLKWNGRVPAIDHKIVLPGTTLWVVGDGAVGHEVKVGEDTFTVVTFTENRYLVAVNVWQFSVEWHDFRLPRAGDVVTEDKVLKGLFPTLEWTHAVLTMRDKTRRPTTLTLQLLDDHQFAKVHFHVKHGAVRSKVFAEELHRFCRFLNSEAALEAST